MQTQHVVAERRGDQVQEIDLVAHRQSRARIRELLRSQARLPEQRPHGDAVRAGARAGQPRRETHGARDAPYGIGVMRGHAIGLGVAPRQTARVAATNK